MFETRGQGLKIGFLKIYVLLVHIKRTNEAFFSVWNFIKVGTAACEE